MKKNPQCDLSSKRDLMRTRDVNSSQRTLECPRTNIVRRCIFENTRDWLLTTLQMKPSDCFAILPDNYLEKRTLLCHPQTVTPCILVSSIARHVIASFRFQERLTLHYSILYFHICGLINKEITYATHLFHIKQQNANQKFITIYILCGKHYERFRRLFWDYNSPLF